MKATVTLVLLLAVFVVLLTVAATGELEGRELSVRTPCKGCVSFPRNVPNFRTRFRHQRIPHPRHESGSIGRKMLQTSELPPSTATLHFHASTAAAAAQIDHPDRYVPGGPDPLHHRSTPPSLIPDLN